MPYKKVHDSCTENILTDGEIMDILCAAKADLSRNTCYLSVMHNMWKNYNILKIEALLSEMKKIDIGLVYSSNAEDFYEQFYTAILYSPSSFLPGLEFPLSVELLCKTADKVLFHYKDRKAKMLNQVSHQLFLPKK